ncbi:olfactory receptor 8G50-like [Loxodonta africana]|uniref:olfactory receptor 8G50-like n=1 Tax=Loxodonta africana TaxID=9785 RepID=UPI0030D122ED
MIAQQVTKTKNQETSFGRQVLRIMGSGIQKINIQSSSRGTYVVTVMGDLGIITLIGLSSHLHTPIVSYVGCDDIDHYVAICNILLYSVTMSYQVCSWLVLEVYVMGFIGATVHTGCTLRVIFCKAKIINHYICDLFPLLELSCSSTYTNEPVLFCFSGLNILGPALAILGLYISIIASILKIHSTASRSKAFSICCSHISAVSIFYGSLAFMYLQSSNVSSMDQGKVSSVFYTIIVPMLNRLSTA